MTTRITTVCPVVLLTLEELNGSVDNEMVSLEFNSPAGVLNPLTICRQLRR